MGSTQMTQLTDLPNDLPIQIDDGKCNHLKDIELPNITLHSTSENEINL
jgi:hypothetical protein